MIKKNNKDTAEIYRGSLAIAFVYKGARLVWQAVASCFGAGYWINNYPWSNTDAWGKNS